MGSAPKLHHKRFRQKNGSLIKSIFFPTFFLSLILFWIRLFDTRYKHIILMATVSFSLETD